LLKEVVVIEKYVVIQKEKNGRLIRKRCYKAGKLLCGFRKFVRRCRIHKRGIVCCTRGYKNNVKLYHKCKLFFQKKN